MRAGAAMRASFPESVPKGGDYSADTCSMRKAALLACMVFPVWTTAAAGQELLDSARLSVSRAIGRTPVAFHYFEKAGALGINRKKEREYLVEESGDGFVARLIIADEGRHYKEDPRPQVQVGDTASYDFAMVINKVNPFEPDLAAGAFAEGEIQTIDGVHTQSFVFECTTTDGDGSFSSAGALFVDMETGMLRRIRVERRAYPDDVHYQLWILSFEGTAPDDCRLVENYYESRGKYAVFTYKFRTTETYTY